MKGNTFEDKASQMGPLFRSADGESRITAATLVVAPEELTRRNEPWWGRQNNANKDDVDAAAAGRGNKNKEQVTSQ